MVFGHLSPIGVVSPIVVVATQCGNSSSSLKSTVLASQTQRCTGSRLRHRTDGSDSGPSPKRRLVLAASRVRPRSASQSTQTAQGLCTSATMRPTKRRSSRFRVPGGRAIPCISGIARNVCYPSLRPPAGVLVPWSCRVGLSCRRNLAQMDLFRAANGQLWEEGGTSPQLHAKRVRTAVRA
jgi:hypothetical protein